jgi:division protein CdvB (Snf7/Vps24/ESCRT-III family)
LGKVLMNSAQAWTALGIFAAALALIITLVLQLIDAKIKIVITRLDQIDSRLQRLSERTP